MQKITSWRLIRLYTIFAYPKCAPHMECENMIGLRPNWWYSIWFKHKFQLSVSDSKFRCILFLYDLNPILTIERYLQSSNLNVNLYLIRARSAFEKFLKDCECIFYCGRLSQYTFSLETPKKDTKIPTF